ncbi:ADP-glyceromanno-heptose 6-epimerase [Bacteroidetes/Chlorobi group bacterium Naka2016]|jgi:ADP-L-glycero-D-manno-heptose 6-epimerase|nr:MAG: ADP-glyceromanno-heptose 6-epimerase [Bacteroidetes/Chlorobi group bacterium Naka2016]
MILLTGGAGFIGSVFLNLLNDKGITDVIVVDHLSQNEKWKNLVGKKFVEYFNKDEFLNLFDTKKFTNFRFDAIFHFGACTNTYERNVDYLIENNFRYSIKLAQLAADKSIRFIYASSAATYGLGNNGYDDNLVFELQPLNAYGFSKYLFDCWVVVNGLLDQFTGLKFFNVYGPNEYHKGEMASMVYKSFLQVNQTGKIKLFKSNSPRYADGEQKRDFVYVKDVVNLVWKIYENGLTGIYNIGTGKARSWNSLANAVFKTLNLEPKIEYIDMPKELESQYQNFTEAKMDKLLSKIGDFEFTSLEDGVSDYINNYLLQDWKYL